MKRISVAAAAFACLISPPANAFDGWRIEAATVLKSKTATFDYISFDPGTNHVFLGHRKEGLQVFDPATKQLVKTIAGTEAHSSNGALIIPEFDLGVISNEDGTVMPFKLSTLEAGEPIKLAEELDTSHYDPLTKRIFVNVGPGKDGTEVVVLEAPSLKTVGTVKIPSRKAEGADADGKGFFYLAEQDLGKIAKIDVKTLSLVGEWSSPACAAPTAIVADAADDRLFVTCRHSDTVKASFTVFDLSTGATVFSTEIGRGTDSLVFDPGAKRLFSANGITANLTVIEMIDKNAYKVSETLATRPWAKVLAMDVKNQKLYTMMADGTSDASKKINTAVSPYYQNTVFPDTFTVLSIGK